MHLLYNQDVVAWIKTLVIVVSCILGRSRYKLFKLPVTFLSCFFLHWVPGTGSFLDAPFYSEGVFGVDIISNKDHQGLRKQR